MLQHYWNHTIRLFSVINRTLVRTSYFSAEKQSVYTTAQPTEQVKNNEFLFFNLSSETKPPNRIRNPGNILGNEDVLVKKN